MTQPFILVSGSGTSSPFPHKDELLSLARAHCAHVLDLSAIRAENFVDLLALYERADMLVTTDTATLHLAEASAVPTIALIADSPTRWHGSPPKGNVVLAMRYGEFHARRGEIDSALQRNRTSSSTRDVFHVYQDYAGSEEEQRRNALAKLTWHKGWFDIAAGGFTSDATSVGDKRRMPFIKDLIEQGYDAAATLGGSLILLTNTDTCITPGFHHAIQRLDGEAYFSHRRDFARLERPLTQNEIEGGHWYPGSDLFVFTPKWWEAHRDEMPDMILGAEGWDKILRELIKLTGGGEIHMCCYHERHESGWERAGARENAPSNVYCRFLAKKFLTDHGLPLEEMEHLPSDWTPPADVVKVHIGTAHDKKAATSAKLKAAWVNRRANMKKKKQHA